MSRYRKQTDCTTGAMVVYCAEIKRFSRSLSAVSGKQHLMSPNSISQSVGTGGVNRSEDVRTVQALLNKWVNPKIAVDGRCGAKTINAIIQFQRGFMQRPDGRVDHLSLTWTKLVGAAPGFPVPPVAQVSPSALVLRPITVVRISEGGYMIHYSGSVPAGARVLLLVGADNFSMDITGGYKTTQLLTLLSMLDQLNAANQGKYWGNPVPCWVGGFKDGRMLPETKSRPENLQCLVEPVRNVSGIGTSAGFAALGIRDLWYTATGEGRLLHTPLDGKYYFKYGGKFEVAGNRRGFDCTTYVGSVYNLQSGMDYNGEKVATAMWATSCGMEDKTGNEVKEFFKRHTSGNYVMWWFDAGSGAGHVFGVIKGKYHEFTSAHPHQPTPNGYKTGNIQERHLGTHLWTVRQLPK